MLEGLPIDLLKFKRESLISITAATTKNSKKASESFDSTGSLEGKWNDEDTKGQRVYLL